MGKIGICFNHTGTPPTSCDICKAPIANVFVDGIIKINGRSGWANVCKSCHKEYGIGLGTGKGQEWWRDPATGEFAKIEG